MTYNLVPLKAAPLAQRYAQLGFDHLFSQPASLSHSKEAASCCHFCLYYSEIPAATLRRIGWNAADVRQALHTLRQQLCDGSLLVVAPSVKERACIQSDGIELPERYLHLLQAAIAHTIPAIRTNGYGVKMLAHHLAAGTYQVVSTIL